ncbi:MAG: glycosyltransferase family 39 protein [Kiritimatiellae bacterium]|nr:glycosyltransferase family 39 protein [Kiritimatiellia bacterium]
MSYADIKRTLLKWPWVGDLLIGLVVWQGFVLRLRQYFFNRSLWLDEAFIAVAIRDGSWREACIPPLEYSHVVPPLFAACSKLVISVLGPQDYIFRLIPLFFGCAALVLFYYLVREIFSRRFLPVFFSVLLFSCSPTLLYYSTEFKQYIGDVFITVFCLLAWCVCRKNTDGWIGWWLLVLTGAVGVWFSFPLVFVLAGIGVELFLTRVRSRQGLSWTRLILCGAIWGVSFLTGYLFLIRPAVIHNPVQDWLLHFWDKSEHAFAPQQAAAFLLWFPAKLRLVCEGDHGMPLPSWLFLGLLAMGLCWAVMRQRSFFVVFGVTLATVLVASAFKAFPFDGRMILFLRPCFLILMVAGVEGFSLAMGRVSRQRIKGGLVFPLVALFLFYPYVKSIRHSLFHPMPGEEIKVILKEVSLRRVEGEAVYIYFWSEPAFRFYGAEYGFTPEAYACLKPKEPCGFYNEVVYRRDTRASIPLDFDRQEVFYASDAVGEPNFRADMEKMKEKGRFWMIISHIESAGLHQAYAILDELGIDCSTQINVYGANAMWCTVRDK